MFNGRLKENIKKILSVIILSSVLCAVFTACDDEASETVKFADYGTYGSDFARELATEYPYRKPYSDQEYQAGLMIKNEFESLGYQVVSQPVSTESGTSYNYFVKIDGKGFIETIEDDAYTGQESEIRRTVVIGAHYDSFFSAEEIPEGYTYDGISDNASGIGCIMTIAKEIKSYTELGFDVTIVAFGAGNDGYAGARTFFTTLSADERESIEVMYCIENIYAGDKVYASSGLNSLNISHKYEMRRKLYQAYDVAYNDTLSALNGFNLYYNECGILTDLNGDGTEDVYREVTVNKSDYCIFDDAGIPIVFFDSGDYFFDEMSKMKETKNLNLQEFGGLVSGTYLDSCDVLDPILVTVEKIETEVTLPSATENGSEIVIAESVEPSTSLVTESVTIDQLEIRINNIAYVIMESMMKGSDDGITHEQYEFILANPTPIPEPSDTSTVATVRIG